MSMTMLCRRAEEARRQLLQEQDAEYQQVCAWPATALVDEWRML
jgi:hypothetical protein